MKGSRMAAAAVVASLLLLGACGGGDDGDQEAAAQATNTTRGPSPSTTAGDHADKVQDGSIAGLSEKCLSYTGYAATVGLAMAAAMDPSAAAKLEELKDDADLADAPEALRDDFAVMTAYAKDLGEFLAKYPTQNGALSPGALGAMTDFSKSVDQERLTEAGNNINAWLAENCPG